MNLSKGINGNNKKAPQVNNTFVENSNRKRVNLLEEGQ